MKTRLSFCFGIIVITSITIAVAAPQRANNHTAVPWHAAKRAAHETEWARTTLVTNPVSGKVRAHEHKYIELATGLNHQDRTGAFQTSSPNFEITPNGAEARQGQHQVFLGPDISSIGAVEIVTPDGINLKSAPLGIGYFDPTDGRSVLLSAVVNGTGWLTAPNEVIYSNCFANIRASVRYRNSLAGMAQDLILHEQPPPPEAFGLSPLSRLEFFTEFVDETPDPIVTRRVVAEQNDPALRQAMVEPDLTDSTLTFGRMTLGPGKAFALAARSQPQPELPSSPVAKQFTVIEGRKILIESVEHHGLAPLLRDLPAAGLRGISTNASLRNSAPAGQARKAARALPAQRLAQQSTNKIQMALSEVPSPGHLLAGTAAVVIDYESLNNSSATDKTLSSDITYLVTGTYNLNGTTTIEGGTVVKYVAAARLNVNGPITTRTSAYRPAVFTAKDDNTVGETIPGSTGTPSGPNYANPALSFTGPPPSTWDLPHVRIMHAQTAISVSSVSFTFYLSHSQIVKCTTGIDVPGQNQFYIRNVLFYEVLRAFYNPSYVNFHVEHTTFDSGYLVVSDNASPFSVNLKNCVLATIMTPFISGSGGSGGTLAGEYNGFYSTAGTIGTSPITTTVYPFTIQGGGKHYLAANTVFRDAGTLTINAGLLADLRERTTTAPNYLTGQMTASTTLGRDVLRDVDTLDLGYHYPAVDYLVSGLNVVGSTVTLSLVNGLVVASDFNAGTFGLKLSGSHLVSSGDPKRLNRFVGANAVQESPSVAMAASQTFIADTTSGTWPETYYPDSNCRFTVFAQMSAGSHFFNGNYQAGFALRDCQLFGGKIYDQSYAAASPGIQWYNNLFEKVAITVVNASPINFSAHNNTFVGGSVSLHQGTSDLWGWGDNIFDGISLTDNASAIWNSHNAYRNVTGSGLENPQQSFTMSDTYQPGPLGNRYLPVGSNLRPPGGGSITVAQAGLYHHTTLIDQTRELTTPLDIGFHYVALDGSQGNTPFDNDGDGLPDWYEDKNGNATLDFGESNWQVSNNGLSASSALDLFTPLQLDCPVLLPVYQPPDVVHVSTPVQTAYVASEYGPTASGPWTLFATDPAFFYEVNFDVSGLPANSYFRVTDEQCIRWSVPILVP